jgi:hypothetical protein
MLIQLYPHLPFGFYDNDIDFQTDADKITKFCARSLGWPIENVELQLKLLDCF